jgi:hypothetical protein
MPWVTADSEWEFYRETKGKEEGSFAGRVFLLTDDPDQKLRRAFSQTELSGWKRLDGIRCSVASKALQ